MRTFHLTAMCMGLALLACTNSRSSNSNDSVTVAETAPAPPAVSITDRKWKLVELMGQPVADSINGKEPFILLKKADSTYAASGGCNGLGGKYLLNEKLIRIQFTQGISTMMACPDMSIEDGLKKMLESVDNYSVGDSTLSLNKARMAPLARFRETEQYQ